MTPSRGPKLTPVAELLAQAEREQAARDENIAWAKKVAAAAERPGLAGDLRRAIRAARRLPRQLALATRIQPHRLDAFLAAEGNLSVEEMERITEALELRLVHASGSTDNSAAK